MVYVDCTGGAWRALPVDVPPWQTVDGCVAGWQATGVTTGRQDGLRGRLRVAEGRHPDPTAGAIDSQSGHGADTVGPDSQGDDAGKKTGGRKRFIVTVTLGLLLTVLVCAASVPDRQGAPAHPARLVPGPRRPDPPPRYLVADGGFAGQLVDWAHRLLRSTVEVVRKPAGQRGVAVIGRRWVGERTFAWLTAHRRLARDDERLTTHAEAMISWAMIGIMIRRLDRGHPVTRPGPRPLTKAA